LVLRGLDILTSKETIESKLIELTLVYMKNCAIVKDNYTGVSRGFAFVEYNSIHVSKDFRMIDLKKKIFVQRIRY
jgi:RNA recognition motif-containing protein